MTLKFVFILLLGFVIGMVSTIALLNISQENRPSTASAYVVADDNSEASGLFITRVLGLTNEERASPYDWISEEKINVESDKITISIKDAQWSKFTDTNSMDPVIDAGANAIQIVPKDISQIHVGDIVSYESGYADGTIIHRVVDIGYDDKGWYAIMRGDNNPENDPGKVRFSQVRRVVVAIIY